MGSLGGRSARKNNLVHLSMQDLVLNGESFQQSSLVRFITYEPRRLAGPWHTLSLNQISGFSNPTSAQTPSQGACQEEDNLSALTERLAQQCYRRMSDQKSLFPLLEASGEVFCRREQAAGQTGNEQVYNKDTSHPIPPGKIGNPKKSSRNF